MNGSVRIGAHTVTRNSRGITVSGPPIDRARRKRLRDQADAIFAARASGASDELAAPPRKDEPLRGPDPQEWVDTSTDRWGARTRGPLGRTWTNGQCLQACVASLLGADVAKVPDPSVEYAQSPTKDYLDRYSKRLAETTGYRLEHLPATLCPPRNPNQLWIATIDERPDLSDHCVVARGAYVVHDPAAGYQGSLPMQRVVDGLLVVPATRVVPVLSPQGVGSRIVPA